MFQGNKDSRPLSFRVDLAVMELADQGFIRHVTPPRKEGAGRPPDLHVQVHPGLLRR